MIVKAENHLLQRPMNNFAVPQTYVGYTSCSVLLHARDKCTVFLLLDKHFFNGEIEPIASLVIEEREKFLGLTLVSFWKTCSLSGEPKEGRVCDV